MSTPTPTPTPGPDDKINEPLGRSPGRCGVRGGRSAQWVTREATYSSTRLDTFVTNGTYRVEVALQGSQCRVTIREDEAQLQHRYGRTDYYYREAGGVMGAPIVLEMDFPDARVDYYDYSTPLRPDGRTHLYRVRGQPERRAWRVKSTNPWVQTAELQAVPEAFVPPPGGWELSAL